MKNPVFIIVCLLIATTPLFRGSVHPWAQTIIQIMVILGGIILVKEKYRKNPRADKNPKAGKNQPAKKSSSQNSLPLNRSNRSNRSNRTNRSNRSNRTLWWIIGPVAALGVWSTVMSPHPVLAFQGLMMLAAYLGFFYLVVVSVRSRKEQRALVWVVAGTAVFLCVVGLLKRFDILVFTWWDYAPELGKNHGGTRLGGVYVNSNHMAGFLAMAIPMVLGMFLTRSRSLEARISMICLVVFLIVCQAFTLSRGGWTATAAALVFMAAVLLLKKGFVHKRLVATLLVSIVVTGLIVMASTPVVQRIATLTQSEMEDQLEGRTTIWEGTRNMIKDNLAAGTGPGTYAVAFPPYQVPGYANLPSYAHSDYLQFAAETGILAIPVMMWLIFWFFRTGFTRLKSRSRQTSGIALGSMAAILAILIHSYSDGNLQIPANALLFIALIAAGLRKV